MIRHFDSLFIHVVRGEVQAISASATIHTQSCDCHFRQDSMIIAATQVDSLFFETGVRHADHIISAPRIEPSFFVMDVLPFDRVIIAAAVYANFRGFNVAEHSIIAAASA